MSEINFIENDNSDITKVIEIDTFGNAEKK